MLLPASTRNTIRSIRIPTEAPCPTAGRFVLDSCLKNVFLEYQTYTLMNDLFDPESVKHILQRVSRLEAGKPALWGKMNAAQMLSHCQAPFSVYFGELRLRQSLAGLLFGRMAKRKLFADKPWPRSLPTAKEFLVTDQRAFDEERGRLTGQIERFAGSSILMHPPRHPFFGKMSAQEWSRLAYKHLDHHLQQFGV
jgi:hypothetical protein